MGSPKKEATVSTFYTELGKLIKEARNTVTQAELANLVGLSRGSIANIEKGRQKLLVDTLCKIAKVLKVPPEKLIPKEDLAKTTEGLTPSTRDWILGTIKLQEGGK